MKKIFSLWLAFALLIGSFPGLGGMPGVRVEAAGLEWQTVGSAGFTATSSPYTVIALNSSGVPYVAYADGGVGNKLSVMKYQSNSWTTVGSRGISTGAVTNLSMAIDKDGAPYVIYSDAGNTSKATVQKYNGTSWATVGGSVVSTGAVPVGTSIAMDSDGTPYIAFRDAGNSHKVAVKKYDGSNWVGVNNAGYTINAGSMLSLAIDSDGKPWLSYQESGNINVLKYNGSTWNAQGAAVGSTSYASQLAMEGTTPYVAYSDSASSNKVTVKKYNGSAWEVVGASGFSAGAVNDTSYNSLSLAIDKNKVPYVAYKDTSGSGKAAVKKFTGTQWENVGNQWLTSDSINSISMAIDKNEIPYVGYQDSMSSYKATVMKYADTTVPVTGISGVPTTAYAGSDLSLTGTVVPGTATNTTIVWSVKDAGTTGASISGSALSTTASGTVTVTATIAGGLSASSDYTEDFVITVGQPFVPITGISGTPVAATFGTDLTLTGTVAPADATNQAIVWSVKDAGTTGASISGSTLSTTAAGTVTVTATIANGQTASTDYTQDVFITVTPPFTAVTGISGIPAAATAGRDLTLTGTVAPADATNKTIVWSVKDAGTTGASISGSTLSTTAPGSVTVTATIVNGQTVSTDYTQEAAIFVAPVRVHLIHNQTDTGYSTIQAAVDAAADGDLVRIDAGMFREQVTVTKQLTLQGAGIEQTILEAPNAAELTHTGGDWKNLKGQDVFAIIGVKASGPVVVKDLTVDGRDQGPLQGYDDINKYTYQGIGAYNTDMTVDTVKVTGVREKDGAVYANYPDEPSGMNHNEAIFAESADGAGEHALTVTHSYIAKFQKQAILAWGPTLTVDINDNTIQGYGKTLHSSGNGIQIGGGSTPRYGTKGSIADNRILGLGQVVPEPGQTDSYLNLGQFGPSAILLYKAGPDFSISGNRIEGTGHMPWFNSDTSYNNQGFANDAIAIADSDNAKVQNNIISGFFAAVIEESANQGSQLSVSGNTFTGNGMAVWSASGDDHITLGSSAETIGYKTAGNGIDTITNFGEGDRIQVIGFAPGSVNGLIGTVANAVYTTTTDNQSVVYKYTDGKPVVDFTGGTVTAGDGSLVDAHSVQLSVAGQVTTLFIDTEGDKDAAELQIKLNGIYTVNNFILEGGYIKFFAPPTAPVITAQPQGQTIIEGQTAAFTVEAAGTGPLQYQWKKDGAEIPGATASTLTLDKAATTDAGVYSVTIANVAGTAVSDGVVLTVNPRGEFGLQATAGNQQVSLQWGSVAQSVYYSVYQDNSFAGTVAGSVYAYSAQGLTNGVSYLFEVRALDGNKTVIAVSDNISAIPATVPGSPAGVAARAGNGQATVTFTAPADNGGSPVTGYIVTASPGEITATGPGTTIIVAGLANGTSYRFTVKAVNAIGSGPGSAASNAVVPYWVSSGGSTYGNTVSAPGQSNETSVNVLVNGKSESAGTATTTKRDDKTVITIAVDEAKLEQKLAAEGNNAVVTIPVNTQADVIIGELNGQMVKSMEDKAAVLRVQTEAAAYSLPAYQLNIAAISAQLGRNVELKDIKVRIEIAKSPAETVKVVESSAQKGQFSIVAPPVDFALTWSSGDKTVEISSFNVYVERTIAIPAGADPGQITTGIVVEPDGTVRHVPTRIATVDGKNYAVINSLTNSTYSVVWHPLEFADAASHWAKEAVTDMGSRMVVSGVSKDRYEPDRDITRAEFAAIMVRALGLKPGMGSRSFSDVSASEWYGDYIQTAAEYGLIAGYSNGRFGPMDKITREQAMTIIARAMKITGLKAGLASGQMDSVLAEFGDSGQVAFWAKETIADCVQAGIVAGKNGKLLAPKDEISRAEVAVIVRRLLQKSNLI